MIRVRRGIAVGLLTGLRAWRRLITRIRLIWVLLIRVLLIRVLLGTRVLLIRVLLRWAPCSPCRSIP